MTLIPSWRWTAPTTTHAWPVQPPPKVQTTGRLRQAQNHLLSLFLSGQRRLDQALFHARELTFDDHSRFIFFSDTHRGDKSKHDIFAPNEGLFIHALSHYYNSGFDYIELGDGDDLWRAADFAAIESAYPQVFALLRQFKAEARLHLIVGNHEVLGQQTQQVTKGEFVSEEGLILRHRSSGKRLFAVHGHQMDVWCNQLALITQTIAGLTHKSLGWLAARTNTFSARLDQHTQLLSRCYRSSQIRVNTRLSNWSRQRHLPVISGHTHLHAFPHGGSAPYFNTGSGINPGSLTGIEIDRGALRLIEWVKTGQGDYEHKCLSPAFYL